MNRLTGILTVLALLAAPSAWSQTLAPGFQPDPMTLSGSAGGPVDASVHGTTPLGGCAGFIPNQPQHTITLSQPFEWLSLGVTASGDTTLVIQGPIGWWCNDDDVGLNPGMSGQWAAGTYRVFVGTYDRGPAAPYQMAISTLGNPWEVSDAGVPPTPVELVVPPVEVAIPPTTQIVPPIEAVVIPQVEADDMWAVPAGPEHGTVAIATGFLPDPQLAEGRSGGEREASSLDIGKASVCMGWVDDTPDHLLELSTAFNYLRIDVSSHGDTTLVVQGPSGWLCNDDLVGLNPQVSGAWQPGTYRVWVGSYERSQRHDYRISFTEWPP